MKFSPDEKFSEKLKISLRLSSKISWLFYTSNTAGLAVGRYGTVLSVWHVPPLLNSAWNHTATSCRTNTIPVWRMVNASHNANCRGFDFPATMTDPLLM